MNGPRLFARIVIAGSLVLTAACSSQSHHDNDSKSTISAPQHHVPRHPQDTQTAQQLVAVTWCDPQNAGYRTVQKFDLNGAPVGEPAYFNVAPTGAEYGATEAGCNSGIDGSEMASAFVGDSFDAIVTTKADSGSTHEGFEPSVKEIPEITDGSGTHDPTPNNFYDLTGLLGSARKVIDLPGAMSPDKKVYFVRQVEGTDGDPAYELMRGDAKNPATPVRQLTGPGSLFFPKNAIHPYIASDSNIAGRGTYINSGTYGFEGTDGGLNFGSQEQLEASKGTYYEVTGTDGNQTLHPFYVYNRRHVLASTQEGIYDVTITGDKGTAKKLFDATGNYIGDAQVSGNAIMFVVNTDAGDSALYTVSLTGDAWQKVYSFPHDSAGIVNLLGTTNTP